MITKEDLNKEIEITGYIVKKIEPHILNKSIKFECPSCGSILNIIQNSTKQLEPKRCSCGRKGGFKIISREVVDAQEITIEEEKTNFSYKVYVEGIKLIEKLKDINSKIIIKGKVDIEYNLKSNNGVFVIKAVDLK